MVVFCLLQHQKSPEDRPENRPDKGPNADPAPEILPPDPEQDTTDPVTPVAEATASTCTEVRRSERSRHPPMRYGEPVYY